MIIYPLDFWFGGVTSKCANCRLGKSDVAIRWQIRGNDGKLVYGKEYIETVCIACLKAVLSKYF